MPTPISEVRALLDSADAAEATESVLALFPRGIASPPLYRTSSPVPGVTDAADGQRVRVSTVLGVGPFTDYICRRSGAVGTTTFEALPQIPKTQGALMLTGFDHPTVGILYDTDVLELGIYQNGDVDLQDGYNGRKLKISCYVHATGTPTFISGSGAQIVFKDGGVTLPTTSGKAYMIDATYFSAAGGYWLMEVSSTFTPPLLDP